MKQQEKIICGQTCDCKQFCKMDAENPLSEDKIKQLLTNLTPPPPQPATVEDFLESEGWNAKDSGHFDYNGLKALLQRYTMQSERKPEPMGGETAKELSQLFDNKADCYTEDLCNPLPVMAMTKNRFLQIVSGLQGQSQPQWRETAKELPEKYECVIVYGRYTRDIRHTVYEATFDPKKRTFNRDGIRSKDVTHWQPLPKPPTS